MTARPRSTDRVARVICLTLAVIAVLWAVLVVATPLLVSSRRPAATVVALVTSAVGAGICHQRPERSFTTAGRLWPVCSRCSGLYLGAAVGVLAAGGILGRRSGRVRMRSLRALLVAAALPSAASWALEFAGGPATSTAWRAVLAAPLGAVAGGLLVALAGGCDVVEGPAPTRARRLVR